MLIYDPSVLSLPASTIRFRSQPGARRSSRVSTPPSISLAGTGLTSTRTVWAGRLRAGEACGTGTLDCSGKGGVGGCAVGDAAPGTGCGDGADVNGAVCTSASGASACAGGGDGSLSAPPVGSSF